MTSALSVSELRVSRNHVAVLRGVSFDVPGGSICALMGRSGAGKSTILRCAAALQSFESGSIRIGNFTLNAGPLARERELRALRRRVGMVFQSHALFDHLSAVDNITLAPRRVLGADVAAARHEAIALLEQLGVASRADAHPHQLSGGEAQRVAIARALAMHPSVLLMDEPTAALDPARRGALAHTLRSLASADRSLLIATHDVDFTLACADTVIVLSEGEIVERGNPRDVLTSPSSSATRALLNHSD